MKGIKLNGRFLDLKPDTSTEIARKSPFFAINDFVSEVTTEPLVFPYTPNNAIAFGLPYQYYSQRKKKKYEIEHYSNNEFRGRGTLVIETGTLNLSNIEATEITGYIVYGISNFFQSIKGKKLSDLTLGGKRIFNYTTNNPDDGTGGYWQHFHQTWVDDTIPYVFFPVRNENYYTEEGDVDWLNKLDNNAKLLFKLPGIAADDNQVCPIIPFIRLPYLLEQIFAEFGYQVDFSGLNDTQWEKLAMLNLTKLDWVAIQPVVENGQVVNKPMAAPQITIELKKHVPQDKSISDFIVQLFNRYGWAPLFDPIRKICRYVAVKEADKGTVKDWTKFASPVAGSSFNEEKKIFAFTNEIDNNDEFPSPPDFSNLNIGLPVLSASMLTEPTIAESETVKFCYHENQWWQVQLNEDTNKYEWTVFADNIYNDEPADSTDTITTTISTLPVYDSEYRKEGAGVIRSLFPIMKQEATKNIGYRMLLYHGMVPEFVWRGVPYIAPLNFPFASSTREDPTGTAPLTWSNVYSHKMYGNTDREIDYGIRKYWWSDFLNILQAGEEIGFRFYLPIRELRNFSWNDRILVKNIPYLIKSITEPDPYKGYIEATLKRLTKPEVVAVVDEGGNVVEGVFAKLVQVTTVIKDQPINLKLYYTNTIVYLFSDAAGTNPYTPPPDTLYVYVKNEYQGGGGTPPNISHKYYGVNSSSEIIIANSFTKLEAFGDLIFENVYSLDPSGAIGYTVL